jgi:hypothetical protein
VSNHDLIL